MGKHIDLNASVDELNIPGTRAKHALLNLGVKTVGDLTRLTPADLLKRKNVGRGTLGVITAALATYGLSLRTGRLGGRVWILFHETNSGHSEESDGYVEAVYATEEVAELARLRGLRRLIAEGKDVWFDPDTEEQNDDWTDDLSVFAFEVRTDAPAIDPINHTCPVCGACPDRDCFQVGDKSVDFKRPHAERLARAWEVEHRDAPTATAVPRA